MILSKTLQAAGIKSTGQQALSVPSDSGTDTNLASPESPVALFGFLWHAGCSLGVKGSEFVREDVHINLWQFGAIEKSSRQEKARSFVTAQNWKRFVCSFFYSDTRLWVPAKKDDFMRCNVRSENSDSLC